MQILFIVLCITWYTFQEGAGTLETLIDMQCMWFELECALSYYRQGKLGEALKKCHQVEKVCVSAKCVNSTEYSDISDVNL